MIGRLVGCFPGGMASSAAPPSIRQGVRIAPPDGSVSVEEVLLAVGEQVGYDKLSFASRMNKAVVVFLKDELVVHRLIEAGVVIRDLLVQVSPLSVPSTRITVSGVPPFIPNSLLENELRRFGKLASGFRTVSLGCRDRRLGHVQSLRRQVFMFLESPTQTLDVSFRVKHGDGSYMVYASSGHIKCFECGDVGHIRSACPHKQQDGSHSVDAAGGPAAPGSAVGVVPGAVGSSAAPPSAAPPLTPPTSAPPPPPSAVGVVPGAVGSSAAPPSAATGQAGPAPGAEAAVAGCKVVAEGTEPSQLEASVAIEDPSEPQSVETAEDRASTSTSGQGEACSQISCVSCEGDEMEYESESDTASISEVLNRRTDLYSLEQINEFLDETFNKSVKVKDYFADTGKFIKTVSILKRLVSNDLLDDKKRYRLNKHLAVLRKAQRGKTGKRAKK